MNREAQSNIINNFFFISAQNHIFKWLLSMYGNIILLFFPTYFVLYIMVYDNYCNSYNMKIRISSLFLNQLKYINIYSICSYYKYNRISYDSFTCMWWTASTMSIPWTQASGVTSGAMQMVVLACSTNVMTRSITSCIMNCVFLIKGTTFLLFLKQTL